VHVTRLRSVVMANRDWTVVPFLGCGSVTIKQAVWLVWSVATELPLYILHLRHVYVAGGASLGFGGPHVAVVQSANHPMHVWYWVEFCPSAAMEHPMSAHTRAAETGIFMPPTIRAAC
jgi:hypothetical protein